MNTLGNLIGKHNSKMIGYADVHGSERYNLRLRRQGDVVSLSANTRNGREFLIGQFPLEATLDDLAVLMLAHPKAGFWTLRLFHDERQHLSDAPIPGRYVQWIRDARQHLASGGSVSFYRFGPEYRTRAEFDREVSAALDRRISLRGGTQQGRKHSDDYQTDLKRDSVDLRNRLQARVRVYQFRTPEVRARFSHLLASYDD